MKVLSIEDYFSTHHDNRFDSGIFRVSSMILDILADKGHECISFTPKGATAKPKWRIIESSLVPKTQYHEDRYPQKIYASESIGIINNFEPDIVINHSVRGPTILKKLTEYSENVGSSFIVTVMHGCPVGGTGDWGNTPLFKRLVRAGHSVVGVSDFCTSEWNRKFIDFRGTHDKVLGDGTGLVVCNDTFCFQFLE